MVGGTASDGSHQRRQSKRWQRRLRRRRRKAFRVYLRKPLLRFLPQLLLLIAVLVAGAFAFRELYEQQPIGFVRGLYVTWALVFMEHLLPFPHHPLLQAFYFAVPVLGLVVILDGILRTSYHLLRRDESGRDWILAMAKSSKNHVILVGLGKVGLRTLQQLLRLEQEVIVVERDPECPHLAFASEHQVPVIHANHRFSGLWSDLCVERAAALICATDDDLANLEMAIDARKENPDIRVVLRMFDQELAEKIKGAFGLDLAFSTSEIAAPLFATAASDRTIVTSFYVGSRLFVVARVAVEADSQLAGMTVAELSRNTPVLVLDHERNGREGFFPDGGLKLLPGDLLSIQSEPEHLGRVHRLNAARGALFAD